METVIKDNVTLSTISCSRADVDIDLLESLQTQMLLRDDLEVISRVFGTIGNQTRLKILFMLSETEELCVCDLSDILGQSLSRVSHHLKNLRMFGFVKTRKEAQTVYYSLSNKAYANVLVQLVRMGGFDV